MLDLRSGAEVTLGKPDLALLALARAEVFVDLACVERDTARFTLAERELANAERGLSREQAPALAVEADLQRLRIEAQRLALTGSPLHRERLRQLQDRINMNEAGRHDRFLRLRNLATTDLESRPARPWALDYPVPLPF